jgi:arabinan endo-1,5-alpha-L-arabinosidase
MRGLARREVLNGLAWSCAATAWPGPARAEPAGPPASGLALSGSITPVHDPAIIKWGDAYHLFSTSHVGEAPGLIHWRTSPDLHAWTLRGAVFAELPAWAAAQVPGTRGVWAPDVIRADGEHRLYYSISTFGENTSAIGLATTPTLDPDDPSFGWTDRGLVFASGDDDDFNAIDPNVLIDDDGAHWMTFGSFWTGIKMIALDPGSGLRSGRDRDVRSLARRPSPGAVEAPFLIKRAGFYYLFASFDFCCRGADSTYHTVVGRAAAPTGPYLDREGRLMMEGGGSVVLHADMDRTGRFVGPGHAAILREEGADYIVHHAYAVSNGAPTLRIQRLEWTDDGWPAAA